MLSVGDGWGVVSTKGVVGDALNRCGNTEVVSLLVEDRVAGKIDVRWHDARGCPFGLGSVSLEHDGNLSDPKLLRADLIVRDEEIDVAGRAMRVDACGEVVVILRILCGSDPRRDCHERSTDQQGA